jgi:hypothetical protein
MTGWKALRFSEAVQMFKERQSSLCPVAGKVKQAPVVCMAIGPNCFAGRTPPHRSGGSGARHRNGPTGGFASGMPRKVWMPLMFKPSKRPGWIVASESVLESSVNRYRQL